MELNENYVWAQKADKVGGSYVIILTPEMRDYLGCEKDENGDISLKIKADKGSHGRFIGIGYDKEKIKR